MSLKTQLKHRRQHKTYMKSQGDVNPQQPTLTGATILAIIGVVLAAGWIAFAYYKGNANDSNRILLLHPIVPILLIVLLTRIYRWIEIKSIVILEILTIGVWLFVRLLGALTPFILGFCFAYVFRFLWNALPFKREYQRGIATVLILIVCGGALFYTGRQVSRQTRQMGSGLMKFYYEIVLPYVNGETFKAVAIDVKPLALEDETPTPRSGEEPQAETFYIATNHGVYKIQEGVERTRSQVGITNGALLGKRIHTLTTSENVIYAGTQRGLYRYYKSLPAGSTEVVGADGSIRRIQSQIWHKVEGTPFDTASVQAVNTPHWDSTRLYVGTQKGLYTSKDAGRTWSEVAPTIYGERSIVSVISIEDARDNRITYVASTAQVDSAPLEPITTTVHWYLEGSSLLWDPLPPITQPVYALAGGEARNGDGGGDSQVSDIELYAGTPDGLYAWNRLDNWQKAEVTTEITLLATAPSGLYAGDRTVIRHRIKPTSGWRPFAINEKGVTHTYRDEPIVEQARTYLTERIPAIAQTGGEAVKWISGFVGSIAFGFGGFLVTLLLSFVVFVYANQSFDNYFRSFISLLPEQRRDTVKSYLREIDKNLQQFLKGQVTVIAIISAISCIAYSIIGLPFALVVGILAGVCNAIPTFGPFIGGSFALLAMLMGLAAGDFGVIDFLVRSAVVVAVALGVQTLDNSLVSPKVMSDAVDVDPLLIMFGVIVGATVLGFWGVLLAIPIIVVIKSIIAVSRTLAADQHMESTPAKTNALEEN